ncbi:MAG: glycosyltransferase family 2 protein [Treponema sp.]|jgi:glycosyltransferase involved in cell wall biosynthesis|nr:glycosyltransferase family 2 protein [Treponema sp.]
MSNEEKIISFTVPCYNSASYLRPCVDSLLSCFDSGGSFSSADFEIILIDDGSSDETPAICDAYAARYPALITVVHQENGGHGAGIMRGLHLACGHYFKVVDSDDWLDTPALRRIMNVLREAVRWNAEPDLFIANYVYEHQGIHAQRVMRYANVFPLNRVFSWNDIGRFRPSQYLLMHSVIYRTALLRNCNLELPMHTFYVDNIFVYQPLPFVKSIRYLDENLYHYSIGRADQSVNERVMLSRVDQQIGISKLMVKAHDLQQVYKTWPKLARYMLNYLSMMISILTILLYIDGAKPSLKKRACFWDFLYRSDRFLYRKIKSTIPSLLTSVSGAWGRKFSLSMYRLAQRVYKFN